MIRLLPAVAATTFLLGCNPAPEAPAVVVEEAVVTVPALPDGPGAAYFTIRTNNDRSRLVSITSPAVQRIELHETREEGGRTGMRPLSPDGATFHPSGPLRFEPGGKHAMLFGVDPALRPGGKAALTFRVDPLSEPVTVEAEVRGPGQAHADH